MLYTKQYIRLRNRVLLIWQIAKELSYYSKQTRMKKFTTHLLIFLFLSSLPGILLSQNRKIDSIKNLLHNLPAHETNGSGDSVEIGFLNILSRLYLMTGRYDSSLHYASRALASVGVAEPLPIIKKNLGVAYNNIGLVYYYRGNYPEALKNHFAALKIQESINDKFGVASSYNHIGLIYSNQANYSEALKNHEASLKLKKELNDKMGIVASYVNIGNVHCNQENYPEALKNYNQGLKEAEKTGDMQAVSTCYNNIGSVCMSQKDYQAAQQNFLTSIKITESTGDKYGEAMALINLAEVYNQLKKYKEAEYNALKGLEIASSIGGLELKKEANKALSSIYEVTGKTDKALKYYKLFATDKDSLANEENTRKTLQAQLQYQYEKKTVADSIRVSEERKVIAAQLKHEKTYRFALYGGLTLTLIFALFMVNRFRVTTRQKNIIAMKEKLTKQQKQIIAHQKDLVEGKQKEMLDSINYALRIQRALLPGERLLDKYLNNNPTAGSDYTDPKAYDDKNYFILFKPKDIVSGDFYWATKLKNGEFAIAIADSTGHGVPGAIMSILNIACLNEVIHENIISPNEILFETRKRIINHLKNDGSNEGGKDGMDCSLLSFNFETNQLTYSGANSPVWIIRNAEFIEISPDKMPVGKHARETDSFTLHVFQLQKNDLVYTFTDGYADQFGGEGGKKFMTKKLKELLLSIAAQPMGEQKRILNEVFENWRSNLEQVDDVTVFGFRVV